MSNTTLTADIIAAEAVRILDNNCVMGDLVYRGYEEEFSKKVNGYTIGETLSVRRPTDFTVRDGMTASVQDVTEGKFTITIDKQKGVDFAFNSQDLTLQIGQLSERVIKPAMIWPRFTRRYGTGSVRPAIPLIRLPTLPKPRNVSTSAPCRRTTALRFSLRPINGASWARRLRSTCRMWQRTPIAGANSA
jgi:hypothetical protein